MHVLRLVALGRINTPEQQRLCEALEGLTASTGSIDPTRTPLWDAAPAADASAATDPLGSVTAPKRTRKQKAD